MSEIAGTDLPLSPKALAKARADNTATQLQLEQSAVLRDLRWLFTVLATTNEPTDVVIVNGGLPNLDRMRPELDRVVGTARLGRVRVHTLRVANLTQVVPAGDPSAEIDLEAPICRRCAGASEIVRPGCQDGRVGRGSCGHRNGFFQTSRRGSQVPICSRFEPLATERDGTLHRIEVRIPGRSKLTIHARKEFVVGPGANAPTGPAAGEPANTVNRSPAPTPVIPLNPVIGDLQRVIERASDYVDRFERGFSTVVAEERYVQIVKEWTGAPPSPGDDPALVWRPDTEQSHSSRGGTVLRRRQLLSDLLLVQTPGQTWIGYRDVVEVDGKAIRDRAVRVQQLFSRTARRIGNSCSASRTRVPVRISARFGTSTRRRFRCWSYAVPTSRASA